MRKTPSCLGYGYKYLHEKKNLGKGVIRTTGRWIKWNEIKWEMKPI